MFLPRVVSVAEVVLLAAKAFALAISWATGKTEALVGLRGLELARVRAELAVLLRCWVKLGELITCIA